MLPIRLLQPFSRRLVCAVEHHSGTGALRLREMPIYEYRCESCGNEFEKLVRRVTDVMEEGCSACGEKHLEQQYSTFAARGGNGSDNAWTPARTRMNEGGGCGGGMCGGGMCGQN